MKDEFIDLAYAIWDKILQTPEIRYDCTSFMGYEDNIENLLNNNAGSMFQSDIVRGIGISKSKVSIVLSEMYKNGKILRIKKGKENIIRLNTIR